MKLHRVFLLLSFVFILNSCSSDDDDNAPQLPFVENIESVVEDEEFKDYLQTFIEEYDTDGDGKLSSNEVAKIKKILFGEEVEFVYDFEETKYAEDESNSKFIKTDVVKASKSKVNVKSLKGLEYFSGLEELYIYSDYITELDLSKNLSLKKLFVHAPLLTKLNLTVNVALEKLHTHNCPKLTEVILGNKPNLSFAKFIYTPLNKIDLDKCPALNLLDIRCDVDKYATIQDLDMSASTKLEYLRLEYMQLKTLRIDECIRLKMIILDDLEDFVSNVNFSKMTELVRLESAYALKSLDLTNNLKLKKLAIWGEDIKSLDVTKNVALTHFYCFPTGIEQIDLRNNVNLVTLSIYDTPIKTIDVSKLVNLEDFSIISTGITKVDLTNNVKLSRLGFGRLEKLDPIDFSIFPDLSNLTYMNIAGSESLDISKNTKIKMLNIYSNEDMKTLYVHPSFNKENLNPYSLLDSSLEIKVKY